MFGMKQPKRRETDSKNQEPGILPSSLNFAGNRNQPWMQVKKRETG
jgi:hypothetical protein